MKKAVGRYAIAALVIVCAACGSLGAGSLAQGSKRNDKMGGAAKERDEKTVFEEGLPDAAEEGKSYAYVELKRGQCPVLLVTDGTYGYNGLEASFHSEIYGQDAEGSWQELGVIAGSGTAYPLRYDKNGIYVTGGHFAAYYSVDWEEMLLVCREYATETFDENGNATYVYAEDGKTERLVEGSSYLMAMFDRYEKAALVGFRRVEKEDGERGQKYYSENYPEFMLGRGAYSLLCGFCGREQETGWLDAAAECRDRERQEETGYRAGVWAAG